VIRRLLLWLLACAAFGAVLGAIHTPLALAWAIALVAPVTVVLVYCRRAPRRAPQRYREIVERHFDAEAGPPAGSLPLEEPLLERSFADPGDWRAVAELIAPDFRCIGREIRSAYWSRWTLTPDHERIRAIELVAFTAPPVRV
jgi:hypothetical protein